MQIIRIIKAHDYIGAQDAVLSFTALVNGLTLVRKKSSLNKCAFLGAMRGRTAELPWTKPQAVRINERDIKAILVQ